MDFSLEEEEEEDVPSKRQRVMRALAGAAVEVSEEWWSANLRHQWGGARVVVLSLMLLNFVPVHNLNSGKQPPEARSYRMMSIAVMMCRRSTTCRLPS